MLDTTRKGEIFRTVCELEKQFARLTGDAEKLGPTHLAFLGLGLAVGLGSLGILAWLLVVPLDSRIGFVLGMVGAAAIGGCTAVWSMNRSRPRPTPGRQAALTALRARIDQTLSDYERLQSES